MIVKQFAMSPKFIYYFLDCQNNFSCFPLQIESKDIFIRYVFVFIITYYEKEKSRSKRLNEISIKLLQRANK